MITTEDVIMDNGFDNNNQGIQENGGVSGGETEHTEKPAEQNQGGVYSPQQTYYQNQQNQQNQAQYGAGQDQFGQNPQYGQNTWNQQNYGQQNRYGQNGYQQNNQYGYSGNRYGQPDYGQYQYAQPKKKEKRGASKGFVIGMVAIGMVICLLIGAGTMAFYYEGIGGTVTPGGKGKDSVIINYEPKDTGSTNITDKGDTAYVASKVADTVVEVTTETVTTSDYYGQYITQGAGSGVIISSGESGSYIITCAHVIDGATKVKVTLKDGTQYDAELTASDSQTDIGIIKVNVNGLPCAAIGDFSKVVVGEGVVAIGNPLGTLGGSVTNGIVSALDRDIIIDGTTYNLLQTNAEINPGNSGGGLFNMEGNLIGIVNAKSSGENVEGLGFAIPIDDAMKVAKELIENGYVTGRVKLGFTLLDVQSKDTVYQYWQYSKYFTEYGIYIIESESSDFHTGDRLIAINNIKIESLSSLKSMLLDFKVGDTVSVTVSRLNSGNKSELMTIDLVLKENKPTTK